MWTPKRIVLLVAGFAVFFAAYFLYASTYLGHIDSLPPLPEAYGPRPPGPGLEQFPDITWNHVSVLVLEHHPFVVAAHVRQFLTFRARGSRPIDHKLEQAFGPGCPELKRAYKLDLIARSMVVSAESCNFVNGTIQLAPVSLALFGKEKSDGKGREINTIRADSAILTFDRPVNSPNEISGHKIVEAELRGDIVIVNNRRTASRADDLEVYIPKGPMHYIEAKHLVWTKDNVHLVDKQSQPDPIDIKGEGMEMELVTEAPPTRPGAAPVAKNHNEQITGVKRIELHANVHMHLYSGGSGIMGGTKPAPAQPVAKNVKGPAAKPAKAPREHVYIQTPGRFRYDFFKDYDFAQFDVPAGGAALPQDVTVMRDHGPASPTDQLVCQHLELRLRHRDGDAPAAGHPKQPLPPTDGADQKVEIETVHAAGRGKEVTLTSDSEKLVAFGTDFFYDAGKKITILKGEPEIKVVKDGTVLHAREMQMQDMKAPPRPGQPPEMFQHITAPGPGSIHMPAKGKEKNTTHAYWIDRLISTRDFSRDGTYDRLDLIGGARFVDEEHEQSLQGETIKVWLLPEDGKKNDPVTKAPTPAKKAAAGKPQPTSDATADHGRRPHHIEARTAVVARSREMYVHDTERLVLWFEDVPELPGGPPPGPPTTASPATRPAQPLPPAPVAPATRSSTSPIAPPSPPTANRTGPQGPALPPPPKPPPPRPFDLSARSVEAWTLRAGDRTQLKELRTRGNVHVRQDPARPDERPVDIHGSTLNLTYRPEGNFLVVSGEEGEGPNDLAQLQMDKIYIIGPTVNIDQRDNLVWVDGVGAMQMESATNFQGAQLDHPTPLTVHWNKKMLFDGISSEFLGNIQAEQQNSRLACQRLQVFFDHPISLKDGHQGDQPAKVRTLTCTDKVRVEDVTYVGEQMEKYQLIRGKELEMRTVKPEEDDPRSRTPSAEGNEVEVVGPGDVRILQRGGVDSGPAAGPGPRAGVGGAREVVGRPVSVARGEPSNRRPAPRGGPAEELTMTYVRFGQRMLANSKTNKASFYEAVEVLHFPWDGAHPLHEEFDMMEVRSRELPQGWMYLRCNRLVVVDQKEGGVSHQQMEANVRVYVRTSDFAAEAGKMTFDQQKDLVVFYGTDSAPARFTKYGGKGTLLNEFTGKTIAYCRSTGKCQVDGLDRLFGH